MTHKDLIISTILWFALISFSHHSFAQRPKFETSALGLTEMMEVVYNPINSSSNSISYTDIQGTPYLQSEFQEGELLTNDSVLYKGIFFRYDTYSDLMEFKSGDNVLRIGNTTNIKYVKVADQIFHHIKFINNNHIKEGYYKLLVNGTCNLYSKYKVDFHKQEKPAAYSTPKPARFGDIECNYYINFKTDSKPILIKNKKQLLTLLADKQNEITSLIDQHKLNVREEDDLVQLIEFYNSL